MSPFYVIPLFLIFQIYCIFFAPASVMYCKIIFYTLIETGRKEITMKISYYDIRQEEDGKNYLVCETRKNYPQISKLFSPKELYSFCIKHLDAASLAEERVWLLAVDNGKKIIGIFELSRGTVNLSLLSPRSVYVRLCLLGACSYFVVHNHPSGDITPSTEDISITDKLEENGRMMGIPLLDHIIVGKCGYYSFAENRY